MMKRRKPLNFFAHDFCFRPYITLADSTRGRGACESVHECGCAGMRREQVDVCPDV